MSKDRVIIPDCDRAREDFLRSYAKIYVLRKVEKITLRHSFSYNRIAIKNTKSQWGSCSELRNLNFSYKIIFLPEYLAEYVIVHELCHLEHFNHGPLFWKLVKKLQPQYARYEKELRRYHLG